MKTQNDILNERARIDQLNAEWVRAETVRQDARRTEWLRDEEERAMRNRLDRLHATYGSMNDGFARDKVQCDIRETELNILGVMARRRMAR